MKLFLRSLILFLLIVTINVKADQHSTVTDSLIQKTVADFMQKNSVPGVAIELYVHGKPYVYSFGYADRDKKTPVTQKTIFEMGSLTKLFTSLLFAEEVNAGNLQLTTSVTRYLPQLPARFNDVTLQQLATHTSGLPSNVPENNPMHADLMTRIANTPFFATPGTQWDYSNLSIGLLGYALENATHQSDNQLYKQKILVPLHMQLIGLTIPAALQHYCAQGYDQDGNKAPLSTGLFPAAWGIKASAHDMLLFLHAAISLPNTPSPIVKAMRITQTPYVKLISMQQGLAWQIYPITNKTLETLQVAPLAMNTGPLPAKPITKPVFIKHALIDKTGATFGFRAYIAVIPDEQSGIVILANHYVSNGAIVNLGRNLLLHLAGIT